MHALVVYESMFGNTQRIGEAVAQGLRQRLTVTVAEVAQAATDPDVDVLIVGGPTHAFGMSRTATRQDAADRAGGTVISPHTGLREWLATLADGAGRRAAAFDTRMKVPGLPGSAARGAARRLRRRGWRIVAPPESFYVLGAEGPLRPGEVERAVAWGTQLARTVVATGHSRYSA